MVKERLHIPIKEADNIKFYTSFNYVKTKLPIFYKKPLFFINFNIFANYNQRIYLIIIIKIKTL